MTDIVDHGVMRAYPFDRKTHGSERQAGSGKSAQSRVARDGSNEICSNSVSYPAILQDLSSKGFRIDSTAPLVAGDHINLQVKAERVSAQIRWVNGTQAGGEFDRPVVFPS